MLKKLNIQLFTEKVYHPYILFSEQKIQNICYAKYLSEKYEVKLTKTQYGMYCLSRNETWTPYLLFSKVYNKKNILQDSVSQSVSMRVG
jgi:hypothetical protein